MMKVNAGFLMLLTVYWTLTCGTTVTAVTPLTLNHPVENLAATQTFTSTTCNKELCVSVVSYCTLQQRCSCNRAVNCSCCRDCAICLGDLYKHCCDCVLMCKKNISAVLSTVMSTVDFLPNPNIDLFRALTDEPVPHLRYKIVKFPIVEELAFHHHHGKRKNEPILVEHVAGKGWTYSGMSAAEYWTQVQLEMKNKINMDASALCTVSYFDMCMSLGECSMSCNSMGADAMRWFHNGCCECVGRKCLNYGNPHPKCQKCLP